jgi:hypothetical protein
MKLFNHNHRAYISYKDSNGGAQSIPIEYGELYSMCDLRVALIKMLGLEIAYKKQISFDESEASNFSNLSILYKTYKNISMEA